MSGNDYGSVFDGIAKLAIVGLVAIVIAIPLGLVFLVTGVW